MSKKLKRLMLVFTVGIVSTLCVGTVFAVSKRSVPEPTIADGLYVIKTSKANKFVQVGLGQKDKATIHIGDPSNRENQVFYLAYDLEDGYYNLIQLGSGKCVGVEQVTAGQGTALCQYGANLRDNFKWKIIPVTGGLYELELKSNRMKFDLRGGNTANGTPLHLWPSNGSPAQRFSLMECTLNPKAQHDAVTKNMKTLTQEMHKKAKYDRINFGEQITKISREVVFGFQNAKIFSIPLTVKDVEPKAFWDNPKVECVEADPKWLPCFKKENIKALTIPEGVKRISRNDIAGCRNLEFITVPLSVEDIEEGAFIGCSPRLRVNAELGTLKAYRDRHFQIQCKHQGGLIVGYNDKDAQNPLCLVSAGDPKGVWTVDEEGHICSVANNRIVYRDPANGRTLRLIPKTDPKAKELNAKWKMVGGKIISLSPGLHNRFNVAGGGTLHVNQAIQTYQAQPETATNDKWNLSVVAF